MEPRLNWLIFGAGAIGTYIGANLILHGQNVVFLEMSEAAQYLKENGLRINTRGQEYRILHPDIYTDLSNALAVGEFDVAVFALKSFDTLAALEQIKPYQSRLPPFLCLQNGVENEIALEQVLGKAKVLAGTVTSSIQRREVGSIIIERQRGIGVTGTHPLSSSIIKAMNESGLNAHYFKIPLSMKWSKMLTNLVANASCAILDMSPEEILRHPGLYRVEVNQLQETLAVMRALHLQPVNLPGVPVIPFAWSIRYLPMAISQPIVWRFAGRGRGQKMPSFHIDLHSGRGISEVDFLNGAVVRFGSRLGVRTPVNQWLNQTLMSLVKGEIPLEKYSHQVDNFLNSIHSG